MSDGVVCVMCRGASRVCVMSDVWSVCAICCCDRRV